jgi:hypothetical protein
MSQVKKYDTGTGSDGIQPTTVPTTAPLANQTPKLKFQVNGKDYEQDPQVLQDMFNPVFDQMKAAGVAKERNRSDFFNTFQQLHKQASTGTYNFESSGGKYLTSTYAGPDGANLGLNSDGTTAHKSSVGNIISPFSRDEHQRMAMLNTFIGDNLIKKYDTDSATSKAKADADAAKLKASGLASKNEYVNQFADYQNPATAIYGHDDGRDPNWAHGKFWEPKTGQTAVLQGTFGKMGNYLFDKQLDDPDAAKAFKDKYGYTVEGMRKVFTNRGFANGQFSKPLGMNDIVGLAGDVQVRRNYDPYFSRSKLALSPEAQAEVNTKVEADKALQLKKDSVPSTDGTTFINPKDGLSYADKAFTHPFEGHGKDGNYYEKGNLFSGARFKDNGLTADLESANNGYYWQGKKATKDDFYKNAQSSPDVINAAQAVNKAVASKRDSLFGALENKNDEFNSHNTNSEFAFKDYLNKGQQIPESREISAVYSNMSKKEGDRGARIFAYKAPGQDQFGNTDVLRYRWVSQNGRTVDGNIKQNLDGTHSLISADGKYNVNLGYYKDVDPKDVSREKENPYYRKGTEQASKSSNPLTASGANALSMGNVFKNINKQAEGGIIKAQLGGVVGTKSNDTGFKSASIAHDVLGSGDLSTADKVELGGIASQIGSVVAGFVPVPGASIASAGLGYAGTGAEYASNYMKHGFKWGDVGSALGGAALDTLSALPGVGEFATVSKLGKMVKGAATTLKAGFIAAGATGALGSLGKLLGDKDMDVDDWKNIAGGIQAVVAGKRIADQHLATTANTQNTIKIGDESKPISPSQASAIANAKPGDKLSVAQDVLKDSGYDLSKLNLSDQTTKSFLNEYTLGKFGTKTVDQVPKIGLDVNGRKLIDYDNANWIQRSAIKNVAAQDPKIAGAENFTIGEGGPNATKGSGLNWIANSYKMKYAPGFNAETGEGTLPKPLQLGPSTGKTEGTNFVTPNRSGLRPGAVVDHVDEFAAMGPVNESLAKLNANDDHSVDRVINAINFEPTKNAYGADQMKKALNISDNQKLSRNTITNLFRDDRGLTPEQRAIKNNFLNTHFEKGSVGESLQNKIITSFNHPQSRGFVKFKRGGLIPKMQQGNSIFSLLKGKITNPDFMQNNNVDEDQDGENFIDNKDYGTLAPGAVAGIQKAIPQTAVSTTGVNPKTGSDRLEKQPGLNVGSLLPKNINTSSLSELGRALFTRNLNSQIDTRVERPMMQAPTEVPISVRGNLFATSVANKQANNIVQSAGQMNTSDASLRTGAMLDAETKAAGIRQQGAMQDIDMQNKTREMSQQQQMQAAQARSEVANKNTHTLAEATQAERAANNEKFARMNQPLMDFWKNEDMKGQEQFMQNRQYDTAIGLANKQYEYQQATRPLSVRLNAINSRQSQLDYKQKSGTPLSDIETNELANLNKEESNIILQTYGVQSRENILQLLTRKHYGNYNTPKGYFDTLNSTVPSNKEGGAITNATKLKIEESKENEKNAIATARMQEQSIKDDADNETKTTLETGKQIQQLIMKALS